MNEARSINEIRRLNAKHRDQRRSVGFVPTMGALHDGHLALIREAKRDNAAVTVSVFVNPTQFGPGEDFEAYPRDPARDAELAESAGATELFIPSVEEIYSTRHATQVRVEGLTDVLCGAPSARGPGHFSAVTTVVCKLLNIVQPDSAYFGQKDAQQLVVIRRMVKDLNIPVSINGVQTVREPDGLALSSRNRYLTPDERERASAIPRSLESAGGVLTGGGTIEEGLTKAREILIDADIEPEYLEARDPETLEPVEGRASGSVMIAVAAKLGRARLIDNTVVISERVPQEVDSR